MQSSFVTAASAAACAFACVLNCVNSSAWAQEQSQTETKPRELPGVVVSATPLGSESFEMVMPAEALSGRNLHLKQRATLGESLSAEPGVSATQFGPNASRPIIRGLDGDRIRILQNGAGVLDASAASFDHALSIDPLLADRVEILRGPAALLYGGNAVGGVVNVIDGRIPRYAPAGGAEGLLDSRFDSARSETALLGRIDTGNDRLVLHADLFARDGGDLRIPGYARSSRLRAREPQSDDARGRLPNSAGESDGGALGASLLFGERGYAGVSYQRYNSDYGTVAEENVGIRLRQERWDMSGELRDVAPWATGLKYKFAHSDYRHDEIEDGEVATIFRTDGAEGRVELLHAPIGPLQGALGLQWADFDFSASGEEAFLPHTSTRSAAVFIYEEWPLNGAGAKLSFGVRAEQSRIEARAFAAAGNPDDRRNIGAYSASTGLLLPAGRDYAFTMNLAYTERAPTYQELYADGPHLATDAFEIGDRGLEKERSAAFDLGVRKQGQGWRGALNFFYNRFHNYIALLPSTGAGGAALYRDAADRDLPPSTVTGGFAEPIRQYEYEAVRALLRGFEAQLTLPVWRAGGRRVELELRADYTRADDLDADEPLPRIAPLRWGAAVVFADQKVLARVDLLRVLAQDRVPAGELSTDAFTMLDLSIGYRTRNAGIDWEILLRASNLLDQEARSASSFLKDEAPMAARAISVGVRALF